MTHDQKTPRDHGGGLDAAITRFGGARADWLDLSTGINPVPYPLPVLPADAWTALPDQAAQQRLRDAAKKHWHVPAGAQVLAAPGASALIAQLPRLAMPGRVHVPHPTYNEHAAAFLAQGWQLADSTAGADAQVIVHPNNPTGQWHDPDCLTAPLAIIDESFADVAPDRSLVAQAARPGRVVLKSFGKFWGLAGLRLGFAIARPETIEQLAEWLGPWPVSGPALAIGTAALDDSGWASGTRARLNADAAYLDTLMLRAGARLHGGTSLFRLYEVPDAALWQAHLGHHHVWSRIFPWSGTFIRLGLPCPDRWAQLEHALGTLLGGAMPQASVTQRP
ncbi:threonine-phosphate decarboxylase CobD [Lutimaribacter sp. EGI FJ00015]|uniref:Threonine-phosphate decarboxylase CobD n=1 Tax=Lutimaribacter degradans TaxID=2945989 RepID=A0ACC5ZZX1_9RHOB|nr:threonine-phosphate decarboxylase CobD [Lutimaribacter sp. EGI FJ00013]MCM2563079.1 threonine-phosphate decarboxylase CobD [Lutimaribacter sp. EGI FJ00013]MCO0614258.1 threonine-phosphate decarboxylase CobD [Lutimaribacter sp. EGI FJ00015]MCO0637068.1 threonine-phosphate decarboxylase CobD [Lutimaribacter sp. EGI FJ00014]